MNGSRSNERQADRGLRFRAARHAAIHRDAAAAAATRARPKWRTNTSAWFRGKEIAPRLKAMAEVFELRPYFEWRGLGFISQSALRIRDTYATWDAEQRFHVPGVRVTDPKAAQCGEVLKGVLKPAQCKLFGKECTPEHPVGALMVSSEGSCAAYYNYEHRKALARLQLAA